MFVSRIFMNDKEFFRATSDHVFNFIRKRRLVVLAFDSNTNLKPLVLMYFIYK